MLKLTYKGEENRGEVAYFFEWNGKKEDYSILLRINAKTKELTYFSCSCPYGSFYGQRKIGFEICRHSVKTYAKIILKTYENARDILIKQGMMNPNHIKKE